MHNHNIIKINNNTIKINTKIFKRKKDNKLQDLELFFKRFQGLFASSTVKKSCFLRDLEGSKKKMRRLWDRRLTKVEEKVV
jgi:hypothetical protein